MRQAVRTLAGAAIVAGACWTAISPAAFLLLLRGLAGYRASFDRPAFAPIETFIDWLEAAYGGPLGPDGSISR